MNNLIRYKIGYELSWAAFRRVQGQNTVPTEDEKLHVEIVPGWQVDLPLMPLLMEEVVRLDDGRKAILLRPDHRKVTAAAERLMPFEQAMGHVARWIEGLSSAERTKLEEGYQFYLDHSNT